MYVDTHTSVYVFIYVYMYTHGWNKEISEGDEFPIHALEPPGPRARGLLLHHCFLFWAVNMHSTHAPSLLRRAPLSSGQASFILTFDTVPQRSLSLELSDTTMRLHSEPAYELQVRRPCTFSKFHQTPEVNYWPLFQIDDFPCRLNCQSLICSGNQLLRKSRNSSLMVAGGSNAH